MRQKEGNKGRHKEKRMVRQKSNGDSKTEKEKVIVKQKKGVRRKRQGTEKENGQWD